MGVDGGSYPAYILGAGALEEDTRYVRSRAATLFHSSRICWALNMNHGAITTRNIRQLK